MNTLSMLQTMPLSRKNVRKNDNTGKNWVTQESTSKKFWKSVEFPSKTLSAQNDPIRANSGVSMSIVPLMQSNRLSIDVQLIKLVTLNCHITALYAHLYRWTSIATQTMIPFDSLKTMMLQHKLSLLPSSRKITQITHPTEGSH